jgi:hypothetical protein
MTAPEIWIVVMAAAQVLAVIAMGATGFLIYQRAKAAAKWAQPAMQESKAIAARGKATVLETRNRTVAFYHTFHTLVQHVGRKVQTTTRLAREVVHPDLAPLQGAVRSVAGPNGLAARLSRLHQAGKIAAGQGNGHSTDG